MIDFTSIILAGLAVVSMVGLAWIVGFWDAQAKANAEKRREAIRHVRKMSGPISTPLGRRRAALAELARRYGLREP
jgi:hypothetical protein